MRFLTACAALAALAAAGCGGADTPAPAPVEAAEAAEAATPPATARPEPTPAPPEPAPVVEPEPEPEPENGPVEAETEPRTPSTAPAEADWEREQLDTAAADTAALTAQGRENDRQAAAAEAAAEEAAEEAPDPDGPAVTDDTAGIVVPNPGPQPAPEGADTEPDYLEDQQAEPSEQVYVLSNDQVALGSLLPRCRPDDDDDCMAPDTLDDCARLPVLAWEPGDRLTWTSSSLHTIVAEYEVLDRQPNRSTGGWPDRWVARVRDTTTWYELGADPAEAEPLERRPAPGKPPSTDTLSLVAVPGGYVLSSGGECG